MGYAGSSMSKGEARIVLRPRGWRHRLDRLLRGRRLTPPPLRPANVDMTLVGRVASEQVRAFVESIETYQLLSRSVVHAVSSYRMPDHPGIRANLPSWISERIRFGVVSPDGLDFRYAELVAIEMRWNDECSELLLHVGERVPRGTRAFIAAYLGEGVDAQALRDMPITSSRSGGQDL